MRAFQFGSWVGTAVLAAQLCAAAHATTIPQPIVSNRTVRLYMTAIGNEPRAGLIEASKDVYLTNEAEEPLPATAEVNGVQIPLTWGHEREHERSSPRHAALIYECPSPHLRLTWEWEARSESGPLEHRVTIENLSTEEVWLPMVDSLRLDLPAPARRDLRSLYVEKGADSPSAEGTHLVPVGDGYQWTGYSSTYAFPRKGEARETIPAVLVFDAAGTQSGWYAGIEFSGRTRISLSRAGGRLQAVLGLNPQPGPFKTRLKPGESFVTPTVFLGLFTGGADGAGNQLRPWVRHVLGNPLTWQDPKFPLMVNNSWGSGMQVDEPLALRMIADSKELGLEMFHLDAGWFRAVGDW